jgi:hypothetical protein
VAAPPPPPVAAVAPPPPPVLAGPSAEQIFGAKAIINTWSMGSADNLEHLNYVTVTPGFTADQVEAAKLLIAVASAGTAAAAPIAAPAAPPAATGGNVDAMRTELTTIVASSPTLKSFKGMKQFFALSGTEKKAVTAFDAPELEKLLAIGRQGEEAIKAAIAQAA